MLHAYFKNLRVDKLLVLLLTIVTTVIIVFVYHDRTGNAEWVSTVSGLYEMRHIGIPLKLFYEIQDTGYDLWFTLLIFFLSSNLFSADLFIFRKTKFDVLMKLRKKPRQYYLQSFLINFLLSFGYFLILQLTILLACIVLIGSFYIEHIIQVDTTEINALSTNLILNLVIYISLSVLGWRYFLLLFFQ